MVKYKNTFLISSLVITDLLVFFASFTAAIYVRILISIAYPRLPQFNPNIGTLVDKVWWMPFILIFFINYEGLYLRRLPYWEEAKKTRRSVMTKDEIKNVFLYFTIIQKLNFSLNFKSTKFLNFFLKLFTLNLSILRLIFIGLNFS